MGARSGRNGFKIDKKTTLISLKYDGIMPVKKLLSSKMDKQSLA